MKTSTFPVVIIGAGPVGLAAAAHAVERGETPLVLEAGESVGHAVRQWAHVRMFSPWRYNIDAASRRLLDAAGWTEPDPEHLPTGDEIYREYLLPLATRTVLANHLHCGERVVAITRRRTDKVRTQGRDEQPFIVRTVARDGIVRHHLARAVIDASGTWSNPNPMGGDGLAPVGQEQVADLIEHGIPDVLGARRTEYAGQTVLVVGSGHSAFNTVLALLTLQRDVPDTKVVWAMRKQTLDQAFGGGAADVLPARGELSQRAREAVQSGALTLLNPFYVHRLNREDGNRVRVEGELEGSARSVVVDRVVVATGFRPDLTLLREIRTELDPWLESAREIGPLIDPNLHSCGTVRPHGARELAHPEANFYIVGMKSYGRAPTFLLATGYEQARSVVAELVGDHEAAARVELDLPETGVCSGLRPEKPEPTEQTCCGGAPSDGADACCKLDEEKKAEGEAGCGCGSTPAAPVPATAAAQCCG
jgi:hypothetical protein